MGKALKRLRHHWQSSISGARWNEIRHTGYALCSPAGIEESFALKRKLLLSILAVLPAAFMPLAASSQIAPEKTRAPQLGPIYKYEGFIGWGYTSINQVNQSRSGLQGVNGSLTRDWGKYFGITGEGGHYAWSVTASNASVGKPVVDMFLAGPVLHAPLYGRTSIFMRGLVGGVHTGGVNIAPTVSFAGGIGLGMDYDVRPHVSLRLYGDDIGSDFTIVPYQKGDSPHIRWNAHAALGVVYKF